MREDEPLCLPIVFASVSELDPVAPWDETSIDPEAEESGVAVVAVAAVGSVATVELDCPAGTGVAGGEPRTCWVSVLATVPVTDEPVLTGGTAGTVGSG